MLIEATDRHRLGALTWWADQKPQIERLLQDLLKRRDCSRALLPAKAGPRKKRYMVAIRLREHGKAEDFHVGYISPQDGSLHYELDLTRIQAHGRKHRLNCAIEESVTIPPERITDALKDADRTVWLEEREYRILAEDVIRKLNRRPPLIRALAPSS